MRHALLAALRAAGVSAIAVPLAWLVFGGTAHWPTDVPPIGLKNIDWRPDPAGPAVYISFAGWLVLGVIFALAFLLPFALRHRPSGPHIQRYRWVDAMLVLVGGGVISLAVIRFLTVEPIIARLVDPWRAQEPSLDGWPLGEAMDCDVLEKQADLVTLARNRLPEEERSSVVDVACYREGSYEKQGGAMGCGWRCLGMAAPIVFTLDDGSRRAIGVGCDWWATEGGTGIQRSSGCGLREPLPPPPGR